MLDRKTQIVLMVWVAAVAVVRTQNGAPQPAPPSRPGVSTAQQPAPAGRGAQATASSARGVIRGRVVSAENGAPIRRAQVRVVSVTGGRGLMLTATDDDGRYEATGLPTAAFDVNVSKTGYVSLSYGQRVPSDAPRQVELGDAQVAASVNFSLPRGSVIVATITDANGEPLTGVNVSAMQYRLQNGQRRLANAVSSETNDLGQARLFGLSPGEYFVKGTAPGGLAVAAKDTMYAPTFYPGTIAVREAQRVSVGVGQEASVAFSIAAVKLATINVTVHRADGTPIVSIGGPAQAATGVSIMLRQDTTLEQFARTVYGLATDATGRFSLKNFPPGDYVIDVTPGRAIAAPRDGRDPTPESAVSSLEFARVPVSVAGGETINLDVTTSRAATLSGQLMFDTGRTPTDKSPADLGVIVYATGSEAPLASGATMMKDDYSFTISGVFATGILRLQSTMTGWYTKSVVIDGKEVVQTPIAFEPGRDYKNIQLTLTQKRSEVNGGVIDSRGRAVTEYTVVLFPEERDWWYPKSRVILTARPDQRGQFKIPTLPDGTYFIVALPTLEQGADQDADTLAAIAPLATRVTLREGETRAINLTLQELR